MDRLWQEVSFGFFDSGDYLDSLPANEQDKLQMILQRIERNKPSNKEDLQLPWDTFTADEEDGYMPGSDGAPEAVSPEANAASLQSHDIPPHGAILTQGVVPPNNMRPVHPAAFMPVMSYPFVYMPQGGMAPCMPVYPMAGNVAMPHTVAMAAPQPAPVAMPTQFVNTDTITQEPVHAGNVQMDCGLQQPQQIELSAQEQEPPEFSKPEDNATNSQVDSDGLQGQSSETDSRRGSQQTKYERRNKKRRPRDYYERKPAPQDGAMALGDYTETHSSQLERTSPDSDFMDNNSQSGENSSVHWHHGKDPSPQPSVPVVPDIAQVEQGVQNMSLSSQIYSDGSRTDYSDPVLDSGQDVPVNAEAVPCPSADVQQKEATPSSSPQPCPALTVQNSAEPSVSSDTPNVLSASETIAASQQDSDTVSQTQADSTTLANQNTEPQAAINDSANQETAPDHVMPSTASETSSPVQATTAPSKPSQDKPKVSSWAGLFRGTKTAESATVIYATEQATGEREKTPIDNKKREEKEEALVTVPATEDKAAKHLGEIIKNHQLNHKPISLLPRGLINRGNWCYVNATLQALLACPPFYHLAKALPAFPALSRGPTSTPVIDSIVEFVNSFTAMQIKAPEKKALNAKGTIFQDVQTGSIFEPTHVYKMLKVIQYDAAFKHGRQEDAEEFLSCVLNSLHDEMVAAMKLVRDANSPKPAEGGEAQPAAPVTTNGDYQAEVVSEEEGEDVWEQVGPKKKSIVTRLTSVTTSPVSSIFQGQIRSILHKAGAKESATLQPFFTLQLDIQSEKIWSVKDALDSLVSRENVQGFISAKTKLEVEASRRMLLEQLPPVLILHIKCFVYDKSGGCQKVVKQIEFGVDLEINKELLSPNSKSKYSQAGRKYKLFAVVNHHGTRAVGGHYTTDFFHPGLNGWVRSDDSNIKTITPTQLTKFCPPRVPYLLYYRKVDLS